MEDHNPVVFSAVLLNIPIAKNADSGMKLKMYSGIPDINFKGVLICQKILKI